MKPVQVRRKAERDRLRTDYLNRRRKTTARSTDIVWHYTTPL